MKMKLYLSLITALLFISISFAQKTKDTEEISIRGEFDRLYRVSTNYKGYKVINKEKFLDLKQQVLDSSKASQNLLIEKNNLLKALELDNKKNLDVLTRTELTLETALQKENSISLFGIQLSKFIYNLLLWTLVSLLLILVLYLSFKFQKNNFNTKRAAQNLKDVEHEYEQHRKKALEREQKLRRTLQDEINKQRNS
jgi:preprotein translocase subunit SecF